MVLCWDTRCLDGVDETGGDDSTSSLDVIVEAGIGVLVSLERWERVLEIFELDNDAGPC